MFCCSTGRSMRRLSPRRAADLPLAAMKRYTARELRHAVVLAVVVTAVVVVALLDPTCERHAKTTEPVPVRSIFPR